MGITKAHFTKIFAFFVYISLLLDISISSVEANFSKCLEKNTPEELWSNACLDCIGCFKCNSESKGCLKCIQGYKYGKDEEQNITCIPNSYKCYISEKHIISGKMRNICIYINEESLGSNIVPLILALIIVIVCLLKLYYYCRKKYLKNEPSSVDKKAVPSNVVIENQRIHLKNLTIAHPIFNSEKGEITVEENVQIRKDIIKDNEGIDVVFDTSKSSNKSQVMIKLDKKHIMKNNQRLNYSEVPVLMSSTINE